MGRSLQAAAHSAAVASRRNNNCNSNAAILEQLSTEEQRLEWERTKEELDATKRQLAERDNTILHLKTHVRKLEESLRKKDKELQSAFAVLRAPQGDELTKKRRAELIDRLLMETQQRVVNAEAIAEERKRELDRLRLSSKFLRFQELEIEIGECHHEIERLRLELSRFQVVGTLRISQKPPSASPKRSASRPSSSKPTLSKQGTAEAAAVADLPSSTQEVRVLPSSQPDGKRATFVEKTRRRAIEAEYLKQVRLAQLEAECELEENLHIRARRLAREQAERERLRREQERLQPISVVKMMENKASLPQAMESKSGDSAGETSAPLTESAEAKEVACESNTEAISDAKQSSAEVAAAISTEQRSNTQVSVETTVPTALSPSLEATDAAPDSPSHVVYEADAFEEEPERNTTEDDVNDERFKEARADIPPQQGFVISPIVEIVANGSAEIDPVDEEGVEEELPSQCRQGFIVDVNHDAVRMEPEPVLANIDRSEHVQGFLLPVKEIDTRSAPATTINSSHIDNSDIDTAVEEEKPVDDEPDEVVQEERQRIDDTVAEEVVDEPKEVSVPTQGFLIDPEPSIINDQGTQNPLHKQIDDTLAEEVVEEPKQVSVPTQGLLIDPEPSIGTKNPLHIDAQTILEGSTRNESHDAVEESIAAPDIGNTAPISQGWTEPEGNIDNISVSTTTTSLDTTAESLHNVEMLAAQVEEQVDATVERCDGILAESSGNIEKQIQTAIQESSSPTISAAQASHSEVSLMSELEIAMEAAARKIQAFWRQMEHKLGLQEDRSTVLNSDDDPKEPLETAKAETTPDQSPRDDSSSPIETPRSSSPALEDQEEAD